MNAESNPASTGDPVEIDHRQMLQSIETAVALVEPGSWTILFENARFFQWFPAGADVDEDTLTARIDNFQPKRAVSRLEGRRAFRFESEGIKGERAFPVRVHLRPLEEADENGPILVEVWDVSKEKEVQYMLDSYSDMSEKNARSLQREKERVERLLLNVMPRAVYEELKDYGTTTPQRFESATILMLDFVGFTEMALSHDPSATISELNDIFSAFDQIVEMFGCERIRTMGDGYMAVSGMPEANPDHAVNIGRVALRMRRYLERRNAAHPQEWRARIGINTGSVIGSLVGIQKYVYDLFGPGVNLAARMEQMSEPMRITLNEETADGLLDDFNVSERGEFEIKGFGTQKLYFLDSERR
jgi:class 3 adenylate cyclase